MSAQECLFLLKLRKAQQQENLNVEIDEMFSLLSTAGVPEKQQVTVSAYMHQDSVENMLHDLEQRGYLQILPKGKDELNAHIHLTHRGYHPIQTWLSIVLGFLFRSILVPIVVAMITAYLTVKFKLC